MSETDLTDSYSEKISEIEELISLSLPIREKYIALKYILERSCYEFSQEEPLQFPSFFSRLVFLCQKHQIDRFTESLLHRLRVNTRFLLKNEKNTVSQKDWKSVVVAVKRFLGIILLNEREECADVSDKMEESLHLPNKLRVQVLKNDRENHLLTCLADADYPEELSVRYDVQGVNHLFTSSVEMFWDGAQVNLVASRRDKKNNWIIPQIFVLDPDYLLDVSALAECFTSYGASHLHYFRRKFEKTPATHHILLGNLANFFLDELIYAENPNTLPFRDTFLKAFKQMPFEFTCCESIIERDDFLAFMTKAEAHFEHIRQVVTEDFPKANMNMKRCTLEPSFFCEKYGFQGRLDLLQPAEDEDGLHRIIELKSGAVPFPSTDYTRISCNHEVQTSIYRMIIETVFDAKKRQILPAILYSASEIPGTRLRMPSPSFEMEKRILEFRNQIVIMEHSLFFHEEQGVKKYLREWLDMGSYSSPPKFLEAQLNEFQEVFDLLSPLEMDYFVRFFSFVSRELYILKSGDSGADSKHGVSDLWKREFIERQRSFDLISNLTISDRGDYDRGMVIHFQKHEMQPFVNFREGDICVVYPRDTEEDSALNKQILKGTIAAITSETVVVRFRYKQRNEEYFTKYQHWAVEHDTTDHSCSQMFRSLFAFATATPAKRDLLLGIARPASSFTKPAQAVDSMTERQRLIIRKAISAKDYFLIVGPPGTGKTSVFARKLIENYYSDTKTNILVLAYTNRAVDELCEAIEAATGDIEAYIRIGSELSCGIHSRKRLLQNISSETSSRDELRKILQTKRIYVGTLNSIAGKQELFSMKKFQVAIIDEASQILEPQIIGLLPLFDKFILIGDHKQLSTISLQEDSKARVENHRLNDIGILSCKDSFFERLFRLCQKNGWTEAYDMLTYQGRMHQSLSEFVNKHFYDGKLLPVVDWQSEHHVLTSGDTADDLRHLLASHRIVFIPTSGEYDFSSSGKVNKQEAELVALLSKALVEVYQANDMTFSAQKTLGIITPYRNQIAMIRHQLETLNIPILQEVMVDTVERFQGSQRDVIFISLCMNKASQLRLFCNMNSEKTVDRKLNVALTRARKQIVLVGDEKILRTNPIYNKLLDWIEEEHCFVR